jgi:hypothetical protein
MADNQDALIASMLKRDIGVGVTFAAAMWLTLIFVYVAVLTVVPSIQIALTLGIAMAVLGVFNSLSLMSLIRRYRSERDSIYPDDIYYLELARSAKRDKRERSR